ncbi:MAG: N-6 DNA methylase [Oscillospiraceae bacterium]|jgi:type I restriction-modification system DNA methylase subunit|nr:N-6 DNA methylase [Oscillospiraceae bacterium]
MAHIDKIIKQMGYEGSFNLHYGRVGFGNLSLSAHDIKVLTKLDPYAVYIVDKEPFVLFYEEKHDQEQQKKLNREIWNTQIPVTIICGSSDVKVYSTCDFDKEKSALSEVESIPVDQVSEDSPFSFWEITSQNFWRGYEAKFSGKKLNEQLLDNLRDITEKLRGEYNVRFATKLTLRLIFIRYLIDRGVDLDYEDAAFSSEVVSSRQALISLFCDKNALYKLFAHLKDRFNGNLFELDDETDTSCLTPEVLQLLADFLSANVESRTGQLSFFDLYDFNIIPVELISNIYEILLGKKGRDKDNAFYTPQYLVNYILDASVSSFVRDHGTCKVLDPACGSGIFLVESYRRMVEKELDGEPVMRSDTRLQEILRENIYGIDLNPDAIDVAVFSLYLAVLDYKNPKTLKKEFQLPSLKGSNLFACDFFNDKALLPLRSIFFDFIVGNPPWGKGNELQKSYIKEHKDEGYEKLMQKDDTCRAFILRSKEFSSASTQCSFVLHSKLLYMQKQPSKNFRKFLLTHTSISQIVELSSVRKLVFKNADAPAVILSYSFTDSPALEHRFEYISMKPNMFFRLFNIIVVEKTDIKHVQQKLLLENEWAWKTLVYGLSGDIDNIIHLFGSHISVKEAIDSQNPSLLCHTGLKYSERKTSTCNQKDSTHLLGKPFLNSRAVDHFLADTSQLNPFSVNAVESLRTPEQFEAPFCLVRTGVDMSNYTMRSAFSDVSFLYREVVYSIKGTQAQKPFLLNLTGLLNSNLFAYFNLMLGSFVGIEREKRLVEEVLSFPYMFKSQIADRVEMIQKMLVPQKFVVAPDVDAEIKKLNAMILSAFHLEDNLFVDYALRVQIPQLTHSDDFAIHAVTGQELAEYARLFVKELSAVLATAGKFVVAHVYPALSKHYSAVEVILLDERPEIAIDISQNTDLTMLALTRFSTHRINDQFFALKDVIHFEADSFYIIKPNFYKNWHPAIAQLDLAEVMDPILSDKGGDD